MLWGCAILRVVERYASVLGRRNLAEWRAGRPRFRPRRRAPAAKKSAPQRRWRELLARRRPLIFSRWNTSQATQELFNQLFIQGD
jgi:hypothetical protein